MKSIMLLFIYFSLFIRDLGGVLFVSLYK